MRTMAPSKSIPNENLRSERDQPDTRQPALLLLVVREVLEVRGNDGVELCPRNPASAGFTVRHAPSRASALNTVVSPEKLACAIARLTHDADRAAG